MTTSALGSGSALLVGAGLMGRWHARALGRLGVRIQGVVDPDLGAARGLAARAGGCPVWSTLEDAVSQIDRPGVAHVCSPSATHRRIVSALLAAGFHVLVEKPLAEDAAGTAELLQAARAAGRMLCPVHQFLFQRGVERVEAALPHVGVVRAVDFVAVSAGAAGAGPEVAETIMADILPHPLALLRRLLGPEVAAAEWHVTPSPTGELRATAGFGGSTVGLLVSMAGRPTRNSLRLVCDSGTFHLDLFHGFAVRESPAVSRRRKVARPFVLAGRSWAAAARNLGVRTLRREPAYPGLRELCRRFYAAAVDPSGPWPISADETLDVARVREAILEARGRPGEEGAPDDRR